MKTLIVEDDLETLDLVSRMIRRLGHEVTGCTSSEMAEEQVLAQDFNMAILDWMLPGKSGPEFCRWLRARAHGNDCYILLMTARDRIEDLDEALDAGANDYLIKPLDVAMLSIRLRVAERQVRELAEGNRSRQALREAALRMERLALVARKTQNGVVIMDAKGLVEWTNDAFAEMIQLDPMSIEGQPLSSLLLESEAETSFNLTGVLQKQRTGDGEIEVQRHDGSVLWVHYSVTPLRDDSGEFVAQVCLLSDITTHKKVDEERFKASKIESLGVLAGGIAHDLNNILTVISGNVSVVRAKLTAPNEGLRENLDRADNAAARAAGLSKQLLTFAKGGSPVKQVTDMGPMLEKNTRFALHGSSLTCLFGIAADLRQVEVDVFQMEQVINCLIINAREALPRGGKINVKARNESLDEPNAFDLPAGDYVKTTFQDNGLGINAENLPRLFDPYFSTKPAGSGLGLTICFSVLAKHGGRITAESPPEGGALFTLLIPVAREPDEVASEVLETEQRQYSVLCMDDEPGIREVATALLTMLGYQVSTARDGEEALELYREAAAQGNPFDAVILDATIPGGMGGVATMQALLQENPHVKAIICSGYSDESALAELKSYGFQASLPKPFTGRQLGNLLTQVIGG